LFVEDNYPRNRSNAMKNFIQRHKERILVLCQS